MPELRRNALFAEIPQDIANALGPSAGQALNEDRAGAIYEEDDRVEEYLRCSDQKRIAEERRRMNEEDLRRKNSKPPVKMSDLGANFLKQMEDAKKAYQKPPLTNASSQQNSNAGAGGGLFGSTNNQNQSQNTGGGLFGNNAANSNQNQTQNTSGGLFGSNPTSNNQSQAGGGGLFGNTSNTNQSQASGGGLFGSSTQQIQPQQTGGLFGNTNAQNQNSAGGSGGLFGASNTQTQNQNTSNVSGGGLFGSTQNTGGLFGNQQGGGIKLGTNNLFSGGGGLGSSATQTTAPNMFGQSNNQSTTGLFGGGSTMRPPAQPTAPSLLGATQHAQQNNSAPFGRLSMGQSTVGSQPTVGAVKIDTDTMRPTTRFEDLTDVVKAELEKIDAMIQQQESYAAQIEAFLPKHDENVQSVAFDVDYIKNKAEDVEQSLAYDAQGVEAQRRNTDKDRRDCERIHRVVDNLKLPQSYQYPNISMNGYGSMYGQQRPQQPPMSVEGEDPNNYDTDLIGNYFAPLTGELQNTMSNYANNLAEIESHMRVIESSAITQSQQLAMRQAGIGGGQPNGDETVRELADTLRGFEQSILGVAGVVGECREGVNQLVLGRLGNSLSGMR